MSRWERADRVLPHISGGEIVRLAPERIATGRTVYVLQWVQVFQVFFRQPSSDLPFIEHVDLAGLQADPRDHFGCESLMEFNGK